MVSLIIELYNDLGVYYIRAIFGYTRTGERTMDIKGFTNKETYLVNKWFGGDFIDRLCTDKGHGVIPTRQEFADYMSAHVAS